jgi:hypothetical protein
MEMVQRHRAWEIDRFGQLGRCRLILLFIFHGMLWIDTLVFNDISLLWEGKRIEQKRITVLNYTASKATLQHFYVRAMKSTTSFKNSFGLECDISTTLRTTRKKPLVPFCVN